MIEARVPTGIAGLDEILLGGLVPKRSYLVVGNTGTGKTILSLQWLLDGARRGESGLFITLAEPAGEIERNVAGFGWTLDGIDTLDLSPAGEPDVLQSGEYHVFPPSEVEQVPLWESIYRAIKEKRPARLVIDSVTQLRYVSTDEFQFRKHILELVGYLGRVGCTAMLLFEPTELERETSVALAVDGIIRLRADISPNRAIYLRSVQVEKLRGSDFLSGLHPMRITSEAGIAIFPHRVETVTHARPAQTKLPFNLPQLDDLLDGGLESGTTTIVSGPSGAGKSTLVMQFLTAAVQSGQRAVLYTFEEPVGSILVRSRGVGLPVDAAVKSGALRLVHINPLELYPDEMLAIIRAEVEAEKRRIVAVDSLRGYRLAMEQFGNLVAHLQNMAMYCHQKNVTLLVTNEIEHLTGDLRLTELGVSYMFDNVLLLRYAEVEGRIIRVLACVKKRLGAAQTEVRQLHISSAGLTVGPGLENMRGILTGVPERRA